MKKKLYLVFLFMTFYSSKAQVGIGTVTLNNSATLELFSTTKGLLIPRMTKAEILAIINPVEGLLVYDNIGDRFWYYNAGSWVNIGNGTGYKLVDQDNDTQVHVEKTPDEDVIRFEIAGTDRWAFEGKRIIPMNSGSSIFIGELTGENDDLTWRKNVYIGNNTGVDNISGEDNIGIGDQVLKINTGNSNIGIGDEALVNKKNGGNNTTIGYNSLRGDASTIDNNTTLGHFSNTIGGVNNTSVGYFSLVTGTNSTAIGYNNTAALNNEFYVVSSTFLGSKALNYSSFANSDYFFNTATGFLANNEVNGDEMTSIGAETLYISNLSSATAIGYQALYINATNSTAIGYRALKNNQGGPFPSTAIGVEALENNQGESQVAIGNKSLQNSNGNDNVAIGTNSLQNNTVGASNTAIGFQSLYFNTVGFSNTAIGYQSLYKSTDGYFNVAVGANSLYNTTSGNSNVAIGTDALKANITGTHNTAIGYMANSTGTNLINTSGVGYNANPTASNTIVFGDASIISIGGIVSWSTVSDGRFKKNIKENIIGLDFILKLRPITYQLNMDALAKFKNTPDNLRLKESELLKQKEVYSGFIAQEVEKASKETGYNFHGVDKPKNKQSLYGLRYAEFVVPLVKGMQEQNEELNTIENQLTNLQKEIDEIKAMLNNK